MSLHNLVYNYIYMEYKHDMEVNLHMFAWSIYAHLLTRVLKVAFNMCFKIQLNKQEVQRCVQVLLSDIPLSALLKYFGPWQISDEMATLFTSMLWKWTVLLSNCQFVWLGASEP